MFMKNSSFGFWESVVPILSSAITVGGQLASSALQASAAKSVAKTQAEVARIQMATEERLAQLQLEALKQSVPLTSTGAVRITPEAAGVIYGQPSKTQAPQWLYFAIGGILLFLLLKN